MSVNARFNKRVATSILLLFCIAANGQFSHRGFPHMFWFRQTTARAEAMGRAYTSLDGDFGSVFANPAGLATANSSEIIGTISNELGNFVPSRVYRYFGLSVPVRRRVTMALSGFQMNREDNPVGAVKRAFERRTMLTLAMEPWRDLYIGLNANLLQVHPGFDKASASLFFDVGAIKKLQFSSSNQQHWVSIGSSITNTFWDRFRLQLPAGINRYDLPVIVKAGMCYGTEWGRRTSKDSIPLFRLLVQADYHDLLNSKYQTALRFGAEGTLFDIFILRGGFFTENVDDYGLPGLNRNRVSKWTHGVGIQLPFYRWLKFPVSAKVDYVALPVARATFDPFLQSNFRSFTVAIKWMGAFCEHP